MKNMLPNREYMELAKRCQTFVDEFGLVGRPCPVYAEPYRSQITKSQLYGMALAWIASIEHICESLGNLIPSGRNLEMDPEDYRQARDGLTQIVIMAELADSYLRASVEHPTKKPNAQIGKPKKIKMVRTSKAK